MVVAVAVLGWRCVAVLGFTVDDAFIVFRYAWNLVRGDGPTFNAGEPPVEGVTQVLWMGLVALPIAAGVDAVVASKVLGFALTAATLVVLHRLVTALAASRGVPAEAARLGAAAAVAAWAVLPFTALHAQSGLGTALFTFLVTAFAGALHRWQRAPSSRRRAALVGTSALALGLARPEGNLVALLGIAIAAVTAGGSRRVLLIAIAWTWILPGAVWFAWRWWYYGLPLPLPFYVKVRFGDLFGAGDVGGVAMLGQVLWHVGLLWVPLALIGVVGARARAALPAAAIIVGFLAAQSVPAQVMGYGWRYFFPVLPLLAALAGVGVARSVNALRWSPRGLPAAAAVAWIALFGARGAAAALEPWQRYADGLRAAHVTLGQRLAELRPEPYSATVAIGDAGVVPYLSRWRAIDTYGLNDPAIAATGSHDAARVLDAEPDVVVLLSRSALHFDPLLAWEAELAELAARRGYATANRLTFAFDYHLHVLARPDGGLWSGLADWHPPSAVVDPFGPSAEERLGPSQRWSDGAQHDGFRVAEIAVFRDRLAIAVESTGSVPGSRMFFVHVIDASAPGAPILARHDFLPRPAFDAMPPGERRVYLRRIDPPLAPSQIVRIGVFDPDDPQPPPLPDHGGRPWIDVPAPY